VLTPKREQFALGLAEGLNQSDAYRRAFPSSLKWKDSVLWSKASILAADGKVKARVAELQQKAAEANELTLAQHVATLAELRDEARNVLQLAAAISAEVARGKASGLYVEKHEVTGKGGGPVQSVSMSPDEFRKLAAEIAAKV
jgi:hypothetical protein